MAKKKRKNPPDSTFRNINALKKRVTALEQAVLRLTNPQTEPIQVTHEPAE